MSVQLKEKVVTMPMLALRGVVVFPNTMVHFDVSRAKSIESLNQAMERDQKIFLLTQKNILDQDPAKAELYNIGVIARIRQMLRVNKDSVRVLVEGISRAECVDVVKTDPSLFAKINIIDEKTPRCKDAYKQALIRTTRDLFEEYAKQAGKLPADVIMSVMVANDMGKMSDFITSNIPVSIDDKQFILEQISSLKRIKSVISLLKKEVDILTIDNDIGDRVKGKIDENQREYYLREQMKVISEELYGSDDFQSEANEYFMKISAINADESVKQKLTNEVNKLAKMPQGSHEATVARNYLDTCIALPWNIYTQHKIDIKKSRNILDRDHYGLEKVKNRIIEMLAVYCLTNKVKGQIICLVGPPGVGKTSIAKSVAECMGRKFARVSLGGISDEAEIRGHRKTYIGSMPGRIIKAVKNAGSSNSVILLDEIDKLSNSYKGDPSSALLEALDSEQNFSFFDHYIDIPFDLSNVLFITTANSLETIPNPLLDRMEIIEISSYTVEDKFNIAKKHLISIQLKEHGLSRKNCRITDSAIYKIIGCYTREAGVRKLKSNIASICRHAAEMLVSGKSKTVVVSEKNLKEFLGIEKFKPESLLSKDEVGIVNGLAWTGVGGTLMQLEVAAVPGTGKLSLTGSLGDVMQESAKAAVTYVRSRADKFNLPQNFYETYDIHIHATENAVPKDGPSAGVTITTAVVSCLTGIPVKRDIAMTGEITLRGRVLPIGGLREKTMAAYKAGIKKVFIPFENLPDIEEVDPQVKEAVEFVFCNNIDDILKQALVENPFETIKDAIDTDFSSSLSSQSKQSTVISQ